MGVPTQAEGRTCLSVDTPAPKDKGHSLIEVIFFQMSTKGWFLCLASPPGSLFRAVVPAPQVSENQDQGSQRLLSMTPSEPWGQV